MTWKLEPALTEVINLRKKEVRKKQNMLDQQKAEAITKKQQRNRGRNSVSVEDDKYYDCYISSTNLD